MRVKQNFMYLQKFRKDITQAANLLVDLLLNSSNKCVAFKLWMCIRLETYSPTNKIIILCPNGYNNISF